VLIESTRMRHEPTAPARPAKRSRAEVLPVAIWAGLATAAVGAGWAYGTRHPEWQLRAPPFFADLGLGSPGRLVPAAAVVLATWFALGRVRASATAWAAALGTAAWALALLWADGPSGLVGITGPYDYLAAVPLIDEIGPARFLSTHTESLAGYPIHVQGHPPGMPLVLWALATVGLTGPAAMIALAVAGWSLAVGAALSALRRLGGDERVRRAAPALALSPAALWVASADAFFAGVVAGALALLVIATGRSGRSGAVLALAAGALGGAGVLLTYGAAPLGLIALAVIVSTRRFELAAWAAAGAALILGAAGAAGFWWPSGLEATRQLYWAGVAAKRPFSYFIWANLAVLGAALGPAVLRGIGSMKLRSAGATLVTSAAISVLLADLSGLSKAEVERIWLPFVPWVALAGGWAPSRGRGWWVGATVVLTFALQLVLRSPW
jgi:methylthioxylose transferase